MATETLQSNSLCLLGIHPSLVWLKTLFARPWPFEPCPSMDRDSLASNPVLSRSKTLGESLLQQSVGPKLDMFMQSDVQ